MCSSDGAVSSPFVLCDRGGQRDAEAGAELLFLSSPSKGESGRPTAPEPRPQPCISACKDGIASDNVGPELLVLCELQLLFSPAHHVPQLNQPSRLHRRAPR